MLYRNFEVKLGEEANKYLLLSNFYGLIRRKHICHKENNRSSIKRQHVGSTRSKWLKNCESLPF